MAKKTFPKTVYAIRDDEGFLIAWEDIKGIPDDGEKVAIYQLVEVKTNRIKHTLE